MSETHRISDPASGGLSRKELLLRGGAIGAGALAAGSLSPAAFAKSFAAPKPKLGGHLTHGFEVDPVFVAPFGGTSMDWPAREPAYDSLLEWNRAFINRPALAETWEVKGPREILFHLRKGVFFHNGKEMTSADAKYSFDLMANPPLPGSSASKTFSPAIASTEVVSKYVLRMRLTQPDARVYGFLAWNRFFHVVPEGLYDQIDVRRNAIGTGPYKMLGYTPNDRIEFVRNQKFWKKGLPYLDQLTMLIIKDEASRAAALRAGRIQSAGFSYTAAQQFAGNKDFKVLSGRTAAFREVQISILPGDKKPWYDKRVRQALNYAINRDQLISSAFPGGAEYSGHVAAGFGQWALPDKELRTKWQKFDLTKARALMKAAGYGSGFDVTMNVLTVLPDLPDVAAVLKQQWQAIGVNLQLEPMDLATFVARSAQSRFEFQLTARGFRSDVDGFLAEFHPASSIYKQFTPAYRNVKLWRDIANNRIILDEKKRLPLVLDAERILLDELPQIPLLLPKNYMVVSQDVYNAYVSATGIPSTYLRNAWVA